MKLLSLAALVLLGLFGFFMTQRSEPTKSHGAPPIACKLSAGAFTQRTDWGQQLLAGVQAVNELPDGYVLQFPGDGPWPEEIVGFVLKERECCPFFKFEITLEPDSGPVRVFVGGDTEAKEILKTWFE